MSVRRLPSPNYSIVRGERNIRLVDPNSQTVGGLLARGAPWGMVALNLDDERGEVYYPPFGINTAVYEQRQLSPHLLSSGRSDEIKHQPGGRKKGKEHYERKGRLEEKKEQVRRILWEGAYPNGAESHWQDLEERRKKRKQRERNTRKLLKEKRSNRSNGSKRSVTKRSPPK
jgi:hypothetical protein